MKIAVGGGTGTVGRHVVDVIRERGHEALVLSRSAGVDLSHLDGLAEVLTGVDTVIDLTSVMTQSAEASIKFFERITRNLLDAGSAAGVKHHIVLGIIGSDVSKYGYYAGKMRQEDLVAQGPVPWTIIRTTQFHEFASQIYGIAKLGPIVLVPKMRSQPIASREVAERLVDLALDAPAGRVADLAGPKPEWMARLTREWAQSAGKRGPIVEIPLPGASGKSMRDGTLLPKPGTQLATQTFDDWLASTTP